MRSSATVIQREFDALAPVYESNRLADWYKAHSEEILAGGVDPGPGDILDIGCGSGYLLRRLLRKFPKAQGVGIDVAPAMVAEAQRRARDEGLDKLVFIHDDWEDMSESSLRILSGYRFTLVICANTLHYFSDPHAAVKDVFNLLSEGGTLLVLEREKSGSAMTWLWGVLHRYLIKDHVEFYSAGELAKLFEQTGFSQVRVVNTIRKYLWKGKLFTSIVLLECKKSSSGQNKPNA